MTTTCSFRATCPGSRPRRSKKARPGLAAPESSIPTRVRPSPTAAPIATSASRTRRPSSSHAITCISRWRSGALAYSQIDPGALALLAGLDQRAGDLVAARSHLSIASSVRRADVLLLRELAAALRAEGDAPRADACVQRVLALAGSAHAPAF